MFPQIPGSHDTIVRLSLFLRETSFLQKKKRRSYGVCLLKDLRASSRAFWHLALFTYVFAAYVSPCLRLPSRARPRCVYENTCRPSHRLCPPGAMTHVSSTLYALPGALLRSRTSYPKLRLHRRPSEPSPRTCAAGEPCVVGDGAVHCRLHARRAP